MTLSYSRSSLLLMRTMLNQATIACLLNAAMSNRSPVPPLASYTLSPHWIRVRSCQLCPKPSCSLSPCLELRIPQKLQRLGTIWSLLPLRLPSASFTPLVPHWPMVASEDTPAMLLPMATSCFFCLNILPPDVLKSHSPFLQVFLQMISSQGHLPHPAAGF